MTLPECPYFMMFHDFFHVNHDHFSRNILILAGKAVEQKRQQNNWRSWLAITASCTSEIL